MDSLFYDMALKLEQMVERLNGIETFLEKGESKCFRS